MKLWHTGNVGPHNISKINHNPKKGHASREIAESSLKELYEKGVWEIKESGYTFTVMELFWV